MKQRIMYIEHKTDQSNRGNAWIGKVKFSKTGQTVYFNGMCFKKLKTSGLIGNYYETRTGDEYWISGVKKNGEDRHWAGGGKVMIQKEVIDEYLNYVIADSLDKQKFIPVAIKLTDIKKFTDAENEIW